MTDKRETALARWSRLKRADTEAKPPPPLDGQLPEASTAPRPEAEIVAPREDREDAPPEHPEHPEHDEVDLPDIADLNAESDYSVFLREGVSEEIRRKALRVLWRSDPVLANLDGLNDYDEDFRSTGVIAEAVRTAYKAGKGYLREEDKRPVSAREVEPERVETADGGGEGPEEPDVNAASPADPVGSADGLGEPPETPETKEEPEKKLS